MKILGIETSCDETAVCLLECEGSLQEGTIAFKTLGNAVHTQIESHKKFGGVVPMLAKREHAKNLLPLFKKVLEEAGLSLSSPDRKLALSSIQIKELGEIFGRETEFRDDFIRFIDHLPFLSSLNKERAGGGWIDAIAVTEGPGLEPALWMGIGFAKALGLIFQIPIIPVNHMEGHIMSVLHKPAGKPVEFPAISLLISGGHTELILLKDWHSYELLGETRDDAVGEAFDKVARMLDLPYPGGPEISKLAQIERFKVDDAHKTTTPKYILPRPMIHSKDYDFSFSGIKTAVRYGLEKEATSKEVVAKEFEDAVTEVLLSKTLRAIEEFNAKTLIMGGGVVSNEHIRSTFETAMKKFPEVDLCIPDQELRTDNALMIAIAGYGRFLKDTKKENQEELKANGTLRLA